MIYQADNAFEKYSLIWFIGLASTIMLSRFLCDHKNGSVAMPQLCTAAHEVTRLMLSQR
jgi:hypothetical protein